MDLFTKTFFESLNHEADAVATTSFRNPVNDWRRYVGEDGLVDMNLVDEEVTRTAYKDYIEEVNPISYDDFKKAANDETADELQRLISEYRQLQVEDMPAFIDRIVEKAGDTILVEKSFSGVEATDFAIALDLAEYLLKATTKEDAKKDEKEGPRVVDPIGANSAFVAGNPYDTPTDDAMRTPAGILRFGLDSLMKVFGPAARQGAGNTVNILSDAVHHAFTGPDGEPNRNAFSHFLTGIMHAVTGQNTSSNVMTTSTAYNLGRNVAKVAQHFLGTKEGNALGEIGHNIASLVERHAHDHGTLLNRVQSFYNENEHLDGSGSIRNKIDDLQQKGQAVAAQKPRPEDYGMLGDKMLRRVNKTAHNDLLPGRRAAAQQALDGHNSAQAAYQSALGEHKQREAAHREEARAFLDKHWGKFTNQRRTVMGGTSPAVGPAVAPAAAPAPSATAPAGAGSAHPSGVASSSPAPAGAPVPILSVKSDSYEPGHFEKLLMNDILKGRSYGVFGKTEHTHEEQ